MDKDNEGSSLGKRQMANRKGSVEEDESMLADADAPTPSIFDIGTKQAKAKTQRDASGQPAPFSMKNEEAEVADTPPPSPDLLYQTLAKDQKTAAQSHVSNEKSNLEGKILPSNKDARLNPFDEDKGVTEQAGQSVVWKDKDKEKFASPFAAKEQPDLSYVNPLNQQAGPIDRIIESPSQRPLAPTLTAQQIVEQIVKHMEVQDFKSQGITNTTVTLNYPGVFKDAQVIVTSFDTAKNQFNITFQNLGAQAKVLMDQQATQDSLKHALEVKGYMVHIITATTTIDQPILTDAGNQYRDAREQQQQDSEQDRRGKRERDEDNT